MIKTIINNLLGGLTPYVLPIAVVLSFSSGIYATHIYHQAKEVRQLTDIQEAVVKQDKYNRGVVSSLQVAKEAIQSQYDKLKGKLNGKKVTNVPCTLTSDAVGVWNGSTAVSTDTSGTSETSSGTQGVETSSTGVSIPIELALENKVDNDEEWAKLRVQMNAIIEWDKGTYGK
jgi:hypothetical protein